MLKKELFPVFVSLTAINALSIIIPLTYDVEAHRGTIYVDDNAPPGWYDETHVKTVQEGVDNASAGDTIYVWAGTYTENVDIGKTVTVIGNGSAVTIVGALSSDDHVFEVTIDYVNISGFTVTGATGYQKAGMYLGGVSHCTIFDSYASGNNVGINLYNSRSKNIVGDTVPDIYLGNGIFLSVSSNNTIANNTITNNSWVGILLASSSNYSTITGNTITNSAIGIELSSSSNHIIAGNHILYNTYGIWLSYSSGNSVTGNNMTNNSYGIELDPSSSNTISGNTITNNNRGISLWSSSNNNTLSDNTIRGNTWGGIYLDMSSDNTMTSNTITDNSDNGIGLWSSSNNTILDNSISYNYPGSGIYLSSSNYNSITDNDVSYNAYGISLSGSNNNTITDNTAIDNYQGNGIYLSGSSNNNIMDNTAHDNYWGINLSNSSNNIITGNTAIDNYICGICLSDSSNNNITDNNASHNFDVGIRLSFSNNNFITSNKALRNSLYGIYLSDSDNNSIYNNYFNNTKNAYDLGFNRWNITKTEGSNIIKGPYLGGNYWNDYIGIDADGDGIGDTPYNISGKVNQDRCPLVNTLEYMMLNQGWNLITAPVENVWTAETLGQNITDCTVVIMFNATVQTFLTHVVGVPWDDFPILNGVGYFVYVASASSLEVTGLPIMNVTVPISPGWNIIGWYQEYNTTAESLGDNITGCSVVLMFDGETQTFLTHVVNTPWDNFITEGGMGLFIYTTTASIWYGEG